MVDTVVLWPVVFAAALFAVRWLDLSSIWVIVIVLAVVAVCLWPIYKATDRFEQHINQWRTRRTKLDPTIEQPTDIEVPLDDVRSQLAALASHRLKGDLTWAIERDQDQALAVADTFLA